MPAEYVVRAPRADEAEAVAATFNALGRALHGQDATSVDEVRHWFGAARDPELDLRAAVLPDGTVAAFVAVADFTEDHSRLYVFSVLHPDHGTIELGHTLMADAEQRAAALAAPGAVVHSFCSSRDERARTLLEERGYRLVRHSFRMVADLDEPPPPPDWPDGFELRRFDPERDAEAVYEADMDAFADHWGFVRSPYEEWRRWFADERLDPDLWFLAYSGDEIAGFCLCRGHEAADPDMGWVNVLGVRPSWRRRGLATALLLHAFAEFHRRGRRRVGLGVDAENTTGAVALYERVGMRPVRRFDTWEKAL